MGECNAMQCSPKQVWRWPYRAGQRSALAPPTSIIHDIPCCGHLTRTLEMDDEGYLYVR